MLPRRATLRRSATRLLAPVRVAINQSGLSNTTGPMSSKIFLSWSNSSKSNGITTNTNRSRPIIIAVKAGKKTTTTQSKNGDSSKQITVYEQCRSDNYDLSSAELKNKSKSFALNVSLGFDNIGLNGLVKNKFCWLKG